MKQSKLLTLAAALLVAAVVSGCGERAAPVPTAAPEASCVPTAPVQTAPAVTETPTPSAPPESTPVPAATYPVPDFLEGKVTIQSFLEGEDITYLCQSTADCGAVTNGGQLLRWAGGTWGELYRTDALEPIYTIDVQNITKAWLSDTYVYYTSFALDRDGQLWAFGTNPRGLMPGYDFYESGPVVVMDHVISFTMNRYNDAWAAAVTDQNEVLIWGWTNNDGIALPSVIAGDAVSVMASWDNLYIVTTRGDLVDLGSGVELMRGNVTRTLVKENAVWGHDFYALGADGVLYYREGDNGWAAVAEDVKMVNCNESIAFYVTNTGELYAWNFEVFTGWNPRLQLPDSPTGEKYIKLLDNVTMAAPADLSTGIMALLENGSLVRIHVES